MKNWQIIIVILIIAADLVMIYLSMSRTMTKPLILCSLLIFTLLSLKDEWKDHFLFLTGLVFAWLGDVALLGSGDLYFGLGLSSFLIMQLIYALVFYRQKAIGIHQRKWQVIPVVVVSIFFLFYLLPNVESVLKIPVVIYNLSIMLMVILAILRWKVTGYKLVVAGALCFMFSDALLGFTKFSSPVSHSGIGIMLSYGLAQLFICHGYLIGRSKL